MKRNLGKGYYSGYNIAKYIIRKNTEKTIYSFKKWNIINVILSLLLALYAMYKIIKENNIRACLVNVYILMEAMFFYHLFRYILKIINTMKIKAACLEQVSFLFKLKNKTIVSVL